MINKVESSIEITGFISVLGNEFMQHTGYGVYAFLTHQIIYRHYKQYAATSIPVKLFVRKLVKEHIYT